MWSSEMEMVQYSRNVLRNQKLYETFKNCLRLLRAIRGFRKLFETSESCRVLKTVLDLWEHCTKTLWKMKRNTRRDISPSGPSYFLSSNNMFIGIVRIPMKLLFGDEDVSQEQHDKFQSASVMFIMFWDYLMVEQIFLSPQVKPSMSISNKLVYTSHLTSCQTS